MFLCVTVYEILVMELRSHISASFLSAKSISIVSFAYCSMKYASLPPQSQFTEGKLSKSVAV